YVKAPICLLVSFRHYPCKVTLIKTIAYASKIFLCEICSCEICAYTFLYIKSARTKIVIFARRIYEIILIRRNFLVIYFPISQQQFKISEGTLFELHIVFAHGLPLAL